MGSIPCRSQRGLPGEGTGDTSGTPQGHSPHSRVILLRARAETPPKTAFSSHLQGGLLWEGLGEGEHPKSRGVPCPQGIQIPSCRSQQCSHGCHLYTLTVPLSHTGTICLPSREWDGILLGKHKHDLHYTKITTLIEGLGGVSSPSL